MLNYLSWSYKDIFLTKKCILFIYVSLLCVSDTSPMNEFQPQQLVKQVSRGGDKKVMTVV